MAKANNYKIKDNITADDLDKLGFRKGSWQNQYKDRECVSKCKKLYDSIELNLTIRINPIEFDDFEDVLILDEDFCQAFTPFYGDNYKKEIDGDAFLGKVIDRYNQAMDLQGIFKVV